MVWEGGIPWLGLYSYRWWLDLNSGHMGLKSKSPDPSSSMSDHLETVGFIPLPSHRT